MIRYRQIAIAVVSLLLSLLATQLAGLQVPQISPNTPVIRINVNLVQVDAIVTDATGRPVTDLKVDDFELLQDGKPRPITTFEFVDLKSPAARGNPQQATPQRRGRGVPPPP